MSGVVILCAFVMLLSVFGADALDVLKYLFYQVLYVLLPGILVLTIWKGNQGPYFEQCVRALIVGACVEMTLGLAFVFLDLKNIYLFLPVFYLLIGAIFGRKTFVPAKLNELSFDKGIITSFVFIFLLVFGNAAHNFQYITDQHFLWTAAFANVSTNIWPIPEPFIFGIPLNYHYLFNIHVGLAHYVTGVEIIQISARISLVFHSFLFMSSVYIFCTKWFETPIVGILATVQIMMISGYTNLFWHTFHSASPSIMIKVPSTIIAFQVFLLLSDWVISKFKTNDRNIMPFLLISFVIFVSSGVRANLLPVTLGGFGLVFLYQFYRTRRFETSLALLLVTVISIGFGMWMFYGLGSELDARELLRFSPLNVAVSSVGTSALSYTMIWMLETGFPESIAVLLYLVLALCGRLTFLLPGLFFFLLHPYVRSQHIVLKLMLGGCAIAGGLVLLLIESTVVQEVWAFYWYADIALAIMGAAGTVLLLQARKTLSWLWSIAAGYFVVFLAVQTWWFVSLTTQNVQKMDLPLAGISMNRNPIHDPLVDELREIVQPDDLLVVGGAYNTYDAKALPAAVPGLQLFADRHVLTFYLSRESENDSLTSKAFLVEDDLSDAESLKRVYDLVTGEKRLLLLWLGDERPAYVSNLEMLSDTQGAGVWSVDLPRN